MSDIYDDEAAKIVERVTCGERQPPTWAGIKRVLAMAMEHAVNLAVTEIREGRAAGEVVEVTAGRPADCTNYAPAGHSGHWRDWHRGHGCNLDPDAPKTPPASEPVPRLPDGPLTFRESPDALPGHCGNCQRRRGQHFGAGLFCNESDCPDKAAKECVHPNWARRAMREGSDWVTRCAKDGCGAELERHPAEAAVRETPLTTAPCVACASGLHDRCYARLDAGPLALRPCACVPCGQQWERDALAKDVPRETPITCACRHTPNHVGPLDAALGCPCGPSCPCIADETPATPTGTARDLGQWTADGDDLLDDTPATLTSHGFQVDVIPRFGSRGKQSAMARTIAALLNAAPPPAPAVPATPPDASRAIAKMLGKLDDEDKATFNWLCAGVRELHAVPATNATVPDALALVESVRAEMGRAFEDADHAERAHAMADGLRAAVEAMARDNARLMKERDELRALRQGYEDAREILTRRVFEAEAELAAVRARVAELESEIQRVHNALPFVSAPDGVPDAAAGVRVLAAELAALKERATIIDARLAAAVESVSTSASMTDDEWVPAILPGKVQ